MKDKYLTVTALTKYLKRKFDTDPHLRNIWLRGEISNFKHHSRGHMYLTIKDDQTRIQAVMFAGNNRSLKFRPENGMNVLIKGEVGVFESFGQYQLYIQQMEPDGIGALYLAFEQLKEEMHKQGYFDDMHKKPIPAFPNHIGIITSPTGAAVRDIITTLKRRYPIARLTVIPVLVQGQNAAKSIKEGIDTANRHACFDVLIVGRGGGSIEELWSFNEEIVAKAIFHSSIPVISAVGHETDITISDYVSDLRAPTPTGAAEMAAPSQQELKERLITSKRTLSNTLKTAVHNREQHLNRLRQSYAFRYPGQLAKQKEQELDRNVERLERSQLMHLKQKSEMVGNINTRMLNQHPKKQLEQAVKELNQFIRQQQNNIKRVLERDTKHLANTVEKMTLLNPLEVMKRGFAIPYSEQGKIIGTSKEVRRKDHISVKLHDGTLSCSVLEVKEDRDD